MQVCVFMHMHKTETVFQCVCLSANSAKNELKELLCKKMKQTNWVCTGLDLA